jgi:hypothetical protein
MHRLIQRINLGAQRLKGRIGRRGVGWAIVHAGPNLSGSNNPVMPARQAPSLAEAKVAPGGCASVKARP